ncbi:hypothetical protein B0H14DRAFT_2594414 [Mycena olivaceomarginata]|nr:hypothetical protein B0H14DRAFT_2594414 [Mycena olivaceomarginata]
MKLARLRPLPVPPFPHLDDSGTRMLEALDAFQSRFDDHHEFPCPAEATDSFSAILTKSLAAPIQIMSAQLQDSVKSACGTGKPHISAALPKIVCTSRSKDGGLFLIPEFKDAVVILDKAWSRCIPPATHSHLQADSVPRAAVPDFKDLKNEFMEPYPELGQVVRGKPRTAGSVLSRLESCEKLDLPVSGCHKFGKRIAESLRLCAVELTADLNATSSVTTSHMTPGLPESI